MRVAGTSSRSGNLRHRLPGRPTSAAPWPDAVAVSRMASGSLLPTPVLTPSRYLPWHPKAMLGWHATEWYPTAFGGQGQDLYVATPKGEARTQQHAAAALSGRRRLNHTSTYIAPSCMVARGYRPLQPRQPRNINRSVIGTNMMRPPKPGLRFTAGRTRSGM